MLIVLVFILLINIVDIEIFMYVSTGINLLDISIIIKNVIKILICGYLNNF